MLCKTLMPTSVVICHLKRLHRKEVVQHFLFTNATDFIDLSLERSYKFLPMKLKIGTLQRPI